MVIQVISTNEYNHGLNVKSVVSASLSSST